MECMLSNTALHNALGNYDLGKEEDMSLSTNRLSLILYLFRLGTLCMSEFTPWVSAIIGRSQSSTSIAKLDRYKQYATIFCCPLIWSMLVSKANCLYWFSNFSGLSLWKAPHKGLWSVNSHTFWPSIMCRKCKILWHAVRNSLSNEEYLTYACNIFFFKLTLLE